MADHELGGKVLEGHRLRALVVANSWLRKLDEAVSLLMGDVEVPRGSW